ncbi:hypothetical protein ACLOJK_016259 [Asimina triloba]
MAEVRRFGLGTQLGQSSGLEGQVDCRTIAFSNARYMDIEQILQEAQHRWLRPPEICEILRNYQKFRIAPEPPNMPRSGSLFLFDRKVLRYFRKDGHNWRKKKDGKTVKEAHERLKAGSVDVLHCYYAHGEENENFQRRSYWMLEEDLMHIVLVHYREVKEVAANEIAPEGHEGSKAIFPRTRDSEEILQVSQTSSSINSNFLQNHSQIPSQTTDTSSLNSGPTSEYDDTECGKPSLDAMYVKSDAADNQQAISRFRSGLEFRQSEDRPSMNQMEAGLLSTYFPVQYPSNQNDYLGRPSNIPGSNFLSAAQDDANGGINNAGFGLTFNGMRKPIEAAPWEEVLEHCTMGLPGATFRPTVSGAQNVNMSLPKQEDVILGQLLMDEFGIKQGFMTSLHSEAKWQTAAEDDSSNLSTWSMNHKVQTDSIGDPSSRSQEHKGHYVDERNDMSTDSDQENSSPLPDEFQAHFSNAEAVNLLTSNLDAENGPSEEVLNYSLTTRQTLIDNSKAEGEGGLKKFDSFSRWMSKELGEVADAGMQSSSEVYWDSIESGNVVEDSSISPQVPLDSYVLSPSLSQDQLFSIIDFSPSWTYTGLETKVPAEVLADGVLRCHAPLHAAGRVPFYVTRSNRLACSEVREFEYRVSPTQGTEIVDAPDGTSEILLRVRLGKLLSLESVDQLESSATEKPHIRSKINSLLEENDDEWFQMVMLSTDAQFSSDMIQEQLLQKVLKDKLRAWLLYKVAEGGKGPNVLDEEGQGVLHLAAALGYDWAIAPTLAAGVKIDFRDVHGWTALHWAAYCGRERTVVVLVSLGASPGALTDPTPKISGRTPWDLASSNGQKGIAGYLAEYSLTNQLFDLTLKESSRDGSVPGTADVKAIQTIAERTATQPTDGDLRRLSLKDSLTAVRNASQTAARIHEVYRVHSFHRKQLIEYGDEKFGMSGERALSLISVKKNRAGQNDEPSHIAAIRIQNKFRGWKGRKEFLIIRQRIVKIQALRHKYADIPIMHLLAKTIKGFKCQCLFHGLSAHVRGHQVRKHFRKIIWSVGIVEKAILRWRRRGSGLRGFRTERLLEGPSMQTGSSKEDDYDFLRVGREQSEERSKKALARVRSMLQHPEAQDQYRRLLNVGTEIKEIKVRSPPCHDSRPISTWISMDMVNDSECHDMFLNLDFLDDHSELLCAGHSLQEIVYERVLNEKGETEDDDELIAFEAITGGDGDTDMPSAS